MTVIPTTDVDALLAADGPLGTPADEPDPPRISIQLLGDLEVTRGDGSVVDPLAWHTAKTMDLLRILALAGGRHVRTESLLARLWPDVGPERGHGSLRTAASRIRHAVGFNCLVRQPDQLRLTSATVDVVEFRAAASGVRQAAAASDWDETRMLSARAEGLYRGDFHASDDESGWARFQREELVRLRLAALVDAAQCALEHGQLREAQDLAQVAVQVGPLSEAAHRALMRAHAGLGEVGAALRVYDDLRAHLADELGIDPGRVSRELHLRLLKDPSL